MNALFILRVNANPHQDNVQTERFLKHSVLNRMSASNSSLKGSRNMMVWIKIDPVVILM